MLHLGHERWFRFLGNYSSISGLRAGVQKLRRLLRTYAVILTVLTLALVTHSFHRFFFPP